MRSYTKIPANKPAPKKKVMRKAPKMSGMLRRSVGFKRVGKVGGQ